MIDRKAVKPPNVLFLTIDTLRADALGSYGDPNGNTPALDRLASEGLRFDQAITGGSWTQAAFPPLLTSSYASMFGGCLGPLAAGRPSPIEALGNYGYRTIGITSSPLLGRRFGYDRGFEHFQELIPTEKDPRIRRIKGGERLLALRLTHRIAGFFGRNLRPARRYVSAAEVNEQFMRALEPGRPIFAWLHFMDVHWPYHREEELANPSEIAQAWVDVKHLYRVNWKNEAITPEQEMHYLRLYQAAVRYTDARIGELLAGLDNAGLLENFVIIVASDHGEEFLERGQWGHFEINLHDEIIRVPLIIRLPGGTSGGTILRQVQTLDVMPTVLDLCGCPPPPGMFGQSLVPLWANEPLNFEDRPSISEMWRIGHHRIAVRTPGHKLIWDSRAPDLPALYDLASDPHEREDIARHRPDLVRQFGEVVAAHRRTAAGSAPAAPVETPANDEAMVRRLRDLGYLE